MDSELLPDTFVDLADTMVEDFDIIDFLDMLAERSAQLLDASAAGVLLADLRGELRVAAASTQAAGLLELFQIQHDQGPCLDCYRTGQPVSAADLASAGTRWPQFTAAATQAGLRAVQALRLRGQAERLSLDMPRAFTMLRDYARNSNQRLTDVAGHFIEGGTAAFPPADRHQPGRQ
jgi:hypothetical protein